VSLTVSLKVSVCFEEFVWDLPEADASFRKRSKTDDSDDENAMVERWFPGVVAGSPTTKKFKPTKGENGKKVSACPLFI
jgi:hypothetical protein